METIIREFEEARNNREILNVNMTLAWACYYTKESGNEVPDFTDVIWDEDIEGIISDCKKHGIKEITISSTFSGLVDTIAEFEKHGCKLEGITKVRSRFKGIYSEEKDLINAFKISI